MGIDQLQQIVGPINRGKLESGFDDDRQRTVKDGVSLRPETPPITEDLSRFTAGPQGQRVRDYWKRLSREEREKRSAGNRKNARMQK